MECMLAGNIIMSIMCVKVSLALLFSVRKYQGLY